MPNDARAAGFDLQTAVRLFFDRPEIERTIAKAEARGLRATGNRLRLEARDLLVRRKGPAAPGAVPHVHSRDKKYSLRFILYFYEPDQHRLVVGPVGLTRDPAPGILEHGGHRTYDEVQVAGRWTRARLHRSDAAFDTYPRRQREIVAPHVIGSLGPQPTANSFRDSINPSFRQSVNPAVEFPNVSAFPPLCPGRVPRPCPEAITADDAGMLVVNYRNEPVGLRVYNPRGRGPDGKAGTQTAGLAGDLAFALQSRTDRAIADMNRQPVAGTSIAGTIIPPPLNAAGVGPGDPFTPMPRAYYGDTIRMKIQAGGQEHSHSASIHGMKWLQGGSGFGTAMSIEKAVASGKNPLTLTADSWIMTALTIFF